MNKSILLCPILLISGAQLSNAALVMDIDFQSDTVGSLPSSYSSQTATTQDGNTLVVVDSGSTFTDPFGPSGNKSMVFSSVYDPSDPTGTGTTTSTTSAGLWFQTDGVELVTQGSFTFDANVTSSFLDLRLGATEDLVNGRIDGQGAIRILLGEGAYEAGDTVAPISIYQNGDGGTNADQTFTYGDNISVTLSWVFTGLGVGSYSVSIDGTPITISGSDTFDFYFDQLGVDTVFFRTGTASNTTSTYEFYVDNLQLNSIPETKHAGLLLGTIFLTGALLRRRANRTE